MRQPHKTQNEVRRKIQAETNAEHGSGPDENHYMTTAARVGCHHVVRACRKPPHIMLLASISSICPCLYFCFCPIMNCLLIWPHLVLYFGTRGDQTSMFIQLPCKLRPNLLLGAILGNVFAAKGRRKKRKSDIQTCLDLID